METEFLYELSKAILFLKPDRALIFGSFAEDGFFHNDLDLLIVSEVFNDYFWQDRIKLLNLPTGYIYDTRLYTPKEFKNLLPITNPLRQSIERCHIDLEDYYDNI